jgi:hypothetical protein
MRRLTVLTVLVVVVASCVPTTRDASTYEAKAKATAEKMLSSVRTAELLAVLAGRDRLLPPYAAAAAGGTEDEATAIQGTFDSIQPPGVASDQLRTTLDDVLTKAVSDVSSLRIAARRADFAAMARTRPDLDHDGRRLEAFIEAHQ